MTDDLHLANWTLRAISATCKGEMHERHTCTERCPLFEFCQDEFNHSPCDWFDEEDGHDTERD